MAKVVLAIELEDDSVTTGLQKSDNKFHEFYDNLYQFQLFMDRDKAFSQDVDLGISY